MATTGDRDVRLRSVVEVLDSLAEAGPVFPTALAQLDALCRGGLRAGALVVVGGAPGAGKTSLAAQLVLTWSRQGASVRWGAYDEAPSGVVARFVQSLGVQREEAERPSDEVRARAEREFGHLDIAFGEDCIEELCAGWSQSSARVLVIDSLQHARTSRTPELDSARARVDDVLSALKRIAAGGVIVICTSELNRGSYRSQASADATDPLSSGKESGSIEYAATVLLVLRSIRADSDLVAVSVPKNRIGQKGNFGLQLDRNSCAFACVDLPGDASATDHDAQLEQLAENILELIQATPPWTNEALRGHLKCQRQRLHAALKRLVDRGEIENAGGSRKSAWRPKTLQPNADDEAAIGSSARPPASAPGRPGRKRKSKRRRQPVVPTPIEGDDRPQLSDGSEARHAK